MNLPGGVIIRSMEIDDLNTVFNLGKSLFGSEKKKGNSWNEQNLVEAIADEIEISCVAVRKKQLLGFLIGRMENGDIPAGIIIWLGVREDFINSVIAAEMIKKFRETSISRKAEILKTEIDAGDSHLLEIFQKFGFTEIRDKISMQLDL
jgi:hypothetical protein